LSFFEVCSQIGLIANEDFNYNAQSNVVTFFNGSMVILKDLFYYPSDPNFDSLGSLEITGAFIDEVNQIRQLAYETVMSRIRYKLDEYDLIPKILASCNPSKNWVYKVFYEPYKNNRLSEGKEFIQALVTDNEFISKHYKKNLSKLNEASKQRLLYGNWEYDDDPGIIFEYDKLMELKYNKFVEKGERYIVVDVARFGKDKAVIGYWEGLRLEDIIVIPKSSTKELVDIVEKLEYDKQVPRHNIIYDDDGVGACRDFHEGSKGFVNNARPIDERDSWEKKDDISKSPDNNYGNLKDQCYFELARLVQSNKIFISEKVASKIVDGKLLFDMIVEELAVIKDVNVFKDDKPKKVTSKDDVKESIGRSPDVADMIMMRMFFELNEEVIPDIYIG